MDELTQERASTATGFSKLSDALSGPNSEKLAVRGITILIIYAAIRSTVAAAAKPFWYDELCTRIIALQPNAHAIWNALERGADGQPFSFYIIERTASALLPYERIAFRAPSILAFCCTLLCLFVFVRRRSNGMCALLCASVPVVTLLFTTYSIEARPYSLFVAFLAFALVCYQRAPSVRWVLLMGISLAAAEAMHYYAIFAVIPFAIAETTVVLTARRIRLGVWLAFLCAAVPLAISWKILQVLKALYGGHFWAAPTLERAMRTYTWLFRFNGVLGFGLAAALIIGVLGFAGLQQMRAAPGRPEAFEHFQEYVLACALVALPFIEIVAAIVTHGGLAERYAIPTVLGASTALGFVLPRLGTRTVFLSGVFLLCAVMAQEAGFWSASRHLSNDAQALHDSIETLGNAAGQRDLPMVISDGVAYLQLAYYAPPELSNRLAVLVDAQSSLAYVGTDVVDAGLGILQTLTPLRVFDFSAFTGEHRRFLLDSGGTRFDWWPARLAHDGYSVELLTVEHGHRIYLVDLDKSSR